MAHYLSNSDKCYVKTNRKWNGKEPKNEQAAQNEWSRKNSLRRSQLNWARWPVIQRSDRRAFRKREEHIQGKVYQDSLVCWRKRMKARVTAMWWMMTELSGLRLERWAGPLRSPPGQENTFTACGRSDACRAGFFPPWEAPSVEATSTIRPAGPISSLGLFYRNPKSNWKSKGGYLCFSLRHLPYFSSEKAHCVQQRKPQPFPEKWIMRDGNGEREKETERLGRARTGTGRERGRKQQWQIMQN